VTLRSIKHARWVAHVNGLNTDESMRQWLVDTMSLTRKLISHSTHFRVRCLRQARAVCLADEAAAIGLPARGVVREREVVLECDGRPVVYAHTVVPLHATTFDWPFFGGLGERSLGTTLFGDPRVQRGRLHFARLRPSHPLALRACEATGIPATPALHARRCLYRRHSGLLLVTEVFLPAIVGLTAHRNERVRALS
jgi:chorismate--pyruvate lyase